MSDSTLTTAIRVALAVILISAAGFILSPKAHADQACTTNCTTDAKGNQYCNTLCNDLD